MRKRVWLKIKNILKTKQGVATYLLVFMLMPLMFFVPAAALDFNSYTAIRTHLQNAFDAASQAALTQSTADNYRSDKILYIMTKSGDGSDFVSRFRENIDANFNTNSEIISKIDDSNGFTDSCVIKFKFKNETTPGDIIINIKFNNKKADYGGGIFVNGEAIGTDIEMNLTANAKTPFLSRFMSIFGINDENDNAIGINISNNIRGIRVKQPDDFDTKDWQSQQSGVN